MMTLTTVGLGEVTRPALIAVKYLIVFTDDFDILSPLISQLL